ncbi:MAG: acetoacetyl-CoA synthase [Xanthomonadaceae bacterium]|nr:acetoacetyl-CoA synthase [Xanthomonadaceae bacterium]
MLVKTSAPKPERRAVNLSISGKLIDEARAQKLNLSRVLEEALEAKLREQRALQWREENREAIAFHNERIARDGLWHRGLTRWY